MGAKEGKIKGQPNMIPSEMESPAAKEFAMSLGFAVWAWNELHEMLKDVYALTVYGARSEDAFSDWHLEKSDRNQRRMLEVGAKARLQGSPNLLQELLSMLRAVDRLAERRNNIVHASFGFRITEQGASVIPSDFSDNNRSKKLLDKKLEDKSLLAELRSCREEADRLAHCANELYQKIVYVDA